MGSILEMNKIAPDIGEIAVIWLGQAGFLFKDAGGVSIAVDPYLTDYCEKTAGFKRLSPSVITPAELKVDFLLVSHNHPDHLDAEAVSVMMQEDAGTLLVGPESVINDGMRLGIDSSRLVCLNRGDSIEKNGIGIKAVYADHGELSPDAVGFLLTIGGVRIYFAGDTAYCPDKLGDAIGFGPDIIIPPINGAYGNLNEEEAARLTADTGAKVTIPCHFWTFREHGGNPQIYFEAMKRHASGSKPLFLTPGEIYMYKSFRQ